MTTTKTALRSLIVNGRERLFYCMSLFQEEQFRLKQELSELAISLNMEAQKGRQVVNDHNK